jgi:hypothetical protein
MMRERRRRRERIVEIKKRRIDYDALFYPHVEAPHHR